MHPLLVYLGAVGIIQERSSEYFIIYWLGVSVRQSSVYRVKSTAGLTQPREAPTLVMVADERVLLTLTICILLIRN